MLPAIRGNYTNVKTTSFILRNKIVAEYIVAYATKNYPLNIILKE